MAVLMLATAKGIAELPEPTAAAPEIVIDHLRDHLRDPQRPGPAVVLVRESLNFGRSTVLERAHAALLGEAELLRATCRADAQPFAVARELFGLTPDELPARAPDRPVGRELAELGDRIARLAAARPVVLLLDDAHLCDPATARWLDSLRHTDLPLLLVLAMPPGARPVLALDAADRADRRIELALAKGDPAELAATLTELADPDERLTLLARHARQIPEIPALLHTLRQLPPEISPEPEITPDLVALVVGLGQTTTTPDALVRSRVITPPERPSAAGRRLAHQLARAEMLAAGSAERALALARFGRENRTDPFDWWDVFAAVVHHYAGDPVGAQAILARVRTTESWGHYRALAARSCLRLDRGELAAAQAAAEGALAVAATAGLRGIGGLALTLRQAAIVARTGRAPAGYLSPAQREPDCALDHGIRMITHSRVLLGRGDQAGRAEVLLRCGRDADALGVRSPVLNPWWVEAAEALARLGRRGEAAEAVEAGEERAAQWDTAAARGYARLARGFITVGPRRSEILGEAVAELSRSSALIYEVMARATLARALQDEGHEPEARWQFDMALELSARAGSPWQAERILCTGL